MARLVVKTEGLGLQAVELRMGMNRVGRSSDCELCLLHTTVSSLHAELTLSSEGVFLRDTKSTNGTFLDGQRITESWLVAGQEIKFGEVQLTVESTDALIAIPEYERGEPPPAAPRILDNGLTACPRHSETAATFRCTVCKEVMCNLCVKILRVKGGLPHYHCRLCSHPCERIETTGARKKKGFLERLQDTVKLKFTNPREKK